MSKTNEVNRDKEALKAFLNMNVIGFKKDTPIFKGETSAPKGIIELIAWRSPASCYDPQDRLSVGEIYEKVKVRSDLKDCYKETMTKLKSEFLYRQAGYRSSHVHDFD